MDNHLKKGNIFPDAALFNAHAEKTSMYRLLNLGKNLVYFLRDYSCVLAQYAIRDIAENQPGLEKAGLRIICVVDSTAEALNKYPEICKFPFDIIAGEEGDVYSCYGVDEADSKEHLGNQRTMAKIAEAKAAGLTHGKYDSGSGLRLPAVFLVDSRHMVMEAYYGKTGDDLPTIKEITDTWKI